MADNGVESLLACLDLVSGLDDFDEKEDILANSAEALSNVEASRAGYRAAANPEAVSAMLQNLRSNMRFEKNAPFHLWTSGLCLHSACPSLP